MAVDRAAVRARARRLALGGAASATQLVAPVERRLTAGLTIFTFHDVRPDPSEHEQRYQLATPPGLFRRQVAWIARRYAIVHPDRLLEDEPSLPASAAVLTFDDGWAGTFEHGLPILDDLGLPSIVFLNMSVIEGQDDVAAVAAYRARHEQASAPAPVPATLEAVRPDEHDDFRRYQGRFAAAADLHHWGARPLVRLGSHLYRHWNVMVLTPAELEAEHLANVAALAPFPGVVPLFAFPFGKPDRHFSDEHVERLAALGARRLLSSLPARNQPPFGPLLHRVSLSARDTHPGDWWWAAHHRDVAALRHR